jgi:N-acetylneuraminic acid mutarotase
MDQLTNQVWSIQVRTGKTERLADYPEPMFGVGAAVGVNGGVYVFGGARWNARTQAVENLASAHVYSVAARRWTPLPPLPYANRGPTAVLLDDTHLLIAGGYKNDAEEFVSDTYVFDVTGSRYRPTTALPYKASSVGLVKAGEWLYCLGGEDRKKHRTALVYRIRWRELLATGR